MSSRFSGCTVSVRALVAAAALVAASLATAGSLQTADALLPPGSQQASVKQTFLVNGRTMSSQSFRIAREVGEIAAYVLPRLDGRPVVLAQHDGMLIAWTRDDWLWTLRLQRVDDYTTMAQLVGSLQAQFASSAVAPGWLPGGHRLIHEVRSDTETRQAAHVIYAFNTDASQILARATRGLMACGWTKASPGDAPPQRWQRGAAQVDLVVIADKAGSHLVVHGEAPRGKAGGASSC